MRLLQLQNGVLSLTKDFVGDILPYAILSHTWGEVEQEVTLQDVMQGKGKGKEGYRKIEFCGKQATFDGLHYFWVDTCCIDKSSSAELQESLNSMFRCTKMPRNATCTWQMFQGRSMSMAYAEQTGS